MSTLALLKKQLKNDRRTNLLPAKLGVYSLAIFLVFTIIVGSTYTMVNTLFSLVNIRNTVF